MLPNDATKLAGLTAYQRVMTLAKVLSSIHRFLDGKPGGLIVDGVLVRYDFVLPDEAESQVPVVFKHSPQDDLIEGSLIAWGREHASNYRELHNELNDACGAYTQEHNKMHGVQRMGLPARLWRVPANMNRVVSPHAKPAKKARTIRDR